MKKALGLFLVFWSLLGAHAQQIPEFPSSLPIGSEEKLRGWLDTNQFQVFATLFTDTDPDPVGEWWEYAPIDLPDPSIEYNPAIPLLEQFKTLFTQLEQQVVHLDPTVPYAITYGTWFRVPGTPVISAAYMDGPMFHLEKTTDSWQVPRDKTNLHATLVRGITMPFFPELTTVIVAITNGNQVQTWDARELNYGYLYTQVLRKHNMWVYNTPLATSGLPGTVTVICFNGMVTLTYDHATGELISREISPPELSVQPFSDPVNDPEGRKKIRLMVRSAPNTKVEIEETTDLHSWVSSMPLTLSTNGSVTTTPQIPAERQAQFFRANLIQGLAGFTIRKSR